MLLTLSLVAKLRAITEIFDLTMKLLAGCTMAEFRIQWLLPAQLVLYLTTMAAAFVADMEVGVVFVDLVWCSEFPLVEVSLCAFRVLPSGVLCSSVHVLGTCMEISLV